MHNNTEILTRFSIQSQWFAQRNMLSTSLLYRVHLTQSFASFCFKTENLPSQSAAPSRCRHHHRCHASVLPSDLACSMQCLPASTKPSMLPVKNSSYSTSTTSSRSSHSHHSLPVSSPHPQLRHTPDSDSSPDRPPQTIFPLDSSQASVST